ncbi:hypothetical protein N474_24680 [Pseudoalteromonas luteoviolacea CPMOR-2]|uniref:Spore coat protein U domain-containing protein n=1 Tax=Pseudoalteromonas luteoviolacea DSM 6061 TaxID=1365250 RepID=A0A166Y759_9GAMM|nr:hypothetical protein [Pseudoalteromonas luteoviolacea]KZN41514.1 hypothetical protein N475_10610 [Pseudoalteromonas luteoviolacea DSM 6061]KZN49978.1 hypothetical protein N474_24680 [Pseudoalteromonas luteoviolacea CPMOR-2]MBE0385488.1 hypothetical protein [Pseudoalteromonas luteoviolacea DSM 6061]
MKIKTILLCLAAGVSTSGAAKSISYNATECAQRSVNPGEETLKYRYFSSSSIENTTNQNISVYCPINLEQNIIIESVDAYFNLASKDPNTNAACTLEIKGMANPAVKLSKTYGTFERFSALTMRPADDYEVRLAEYQSRYEYRGSAVSAHLNCTIPKVSDDTLNGPYGFTRMVGYVVNYTQK